MSRIAQEVHRGDRRLLDSVKHLVGNYGVYIAFIVLCLTLSLLREEFLTRENLLNLIRHVSLNGIVATGMTFVIVSGGIDLSVGSVVALAGIVAAIPSSTTGSGVLPVLSAGGLALPLAILLGLGVAAICGGIVGLLVTRLKVAPFIVTLGMMSIARGAALVLSQGRPIINLTSEYQLIGRASFLGIPCPIIIFVVVVVVAHFLLNNTKFGRYVYAVGGSEPAALAAGINVSRIKAVVYILCSTLAGLAGIVLSSRVNAASPIAGVGYELDAIAAAVIGGSSLSGGVGSIPGTIVGALIMGTITNGLDLLNVSAYYQQIIKGIIILVAVVYSKRD